MFYKYIPGVFSMEKTSQEWYDLYYKDNVLILDPDGWNRTPDKWEYSWSKELITRSEFERRLCSSTCIWNVPKL